MNRENTVLAMRSQLTGLSPIRPVGRVSGVSGGVVLIDGLADRACICDRVKVVREDADVLQGEVVQLAGRTLTMLPDGELEGIALGDRASVHSAARVAPSDGWIGRIVDPDGQPLDGRGLNHGLQGRPIRAAPPPPTDRRPMGARLSTGMAAFNTVLPIVTGQRIGLFAGSGVGKSSLLGQLAQNMEADVVVIAMIGERGREVRHFVDEVLGEEGLKRSVVVAATSDQSALVRRRCAWTAMTVAEHFRDQGKSVLFLADSITRFAEAHREVAVAAGEAPVLRGHPPSTSHLIMSLCERAGPGAEGQGDITGVFSVLVAGSDMDEPVADILRGVLDGHVVLDRAIAERGRYPAVDLLKSVSRSLPAAATPAQNETIQKMRKILSTYERNEMMITAGLYAQGSDPEIDLAIQLWPELEGFMSKLDVQGIDHSFNQLNLIMRRAQSKNSQVSQRQS
jgi:flagellum-specific ATP synthase